MNEEEKFDELLNSKLSERDFLFDELNWDEAERLLVQQERRRKMLRFVLIFSSGLAAGMLIMLPFLLNTSTLSNTIATNSSTHQNPVNPTSISAPTNQPLITTNSAVHKEEKVALLPPQSLKVGVQSVFVKKDTRTDMQDNSFRVSNVITKIAAKPSPSLSVVSKNTSSSLAKSDLIPRAANPSSPQPGNSMVAENNNTSSATSGRTEKNNTLNNPISNNTTPDNTPASTIASKPNENTSPPNTITLNNHSPTQTNKPPAITKNSVKDTSASSSAQDDAPHFKTGNLYPNILSVYAGGTYSLGWTNGRLVESTKQANGITPWGGFLFTHYFAGDLSASIGMGYSELTNLKGTYTSDVLQYDFGTTAITTAVSPQTVYYLAFPLKLQYDIDNKNLLGIGCNYLLMLTTYSTLTTYQQTDFSEIPETSEKQNGYTQGFSNSNWQIMVSYTRMLTSRLGLSVEYYRDLDYIENNTIPGLTQSEKNNGFRLVFSYQLLK